MEIFGGLNQKVLQAKAQIEQAQKEFIDSHGDSEKLEREQECLHEYVSISTAEEKFLKQKTRVK